MNENIKSIVGNLLVNASDEDIEKIAVAIIAECSKLEDGWVDSGSYSTFGARLRAHFGIQI